MRKNRKVIPLAAILALLGSLLLIKCKDNEGPPDTPTPEVGIVTLQAQPLTITTELPGRTAAFRIAEIRPQVSGIILKRNFVEGSDVKAGTSLYQIDPAAYQAAYSIAKGDLDKAQANADAFRLKANRLKSLLNTQYISRQDYDQAMSDLRQANASIVTAKAKLEAARINLAYTKVVSPISGRIGKSTVTEGALVTNGQPTALTTVQQLDPIYVDVTQSSDDFLRLQQELAAGALQPEKGKTAVRLLLENGAEYPQIGTLAFSDVTVDKTTGSITLRAIFPNPNGALLPGMFVRACLDEGVKNDALLVPQQGITRNPRGEAIAMVVDDDNKVALRTLSTGLAIGDKWLVTAGLKAGDRVIVSGLQRIKPGIQVTAQEISNQTQ